MVEKKKYLSNKGMQQHWLKKRNIKLGLPFTKLESLKIMTHAQRSFTANPAADARNSFLTKKQQKSCWIDKTKSQNDLH